MAIALCLAALALIAGHLCPTHGTAAWVLHSPVPGALLTADKPLPSGRVNVNTATAQELETLPAIGAEMAKRIIEERTQNGPFAYPQDLTNVKGIGQRTLEKLLPHICLE